MEALNEAFASSFVKTHWNEPAFKSVMEALQRYYSDLDINRLVDENFVKTLPSFAVKQNVDVIKFWIRGGKVGLTTRSNSFFDRYMEVKKNKRGALIGNLYDEQQKCIEGGNKYLATFDTCYVFDVKDAISKNASVKRVQIERKKAREGATALMTNRQIKEMNVQRYIQLLKEKRFSDGSEFNLINNLTRILTDAVKKNTPIGLFFYKLVDSSWLINYLQAYSNTLVDYCTLLDKHGFLLPIPTDEVSKFHDINYAETDSEKLMVIRRNLIKAIEDIKQEIIIGNAERKKMYDLVRKLLYSEKDLALFKQICTDSNKKSFISSEDFDSYIEGLRIIDLELPKAFSNPNISSDIMNLDMLITQLTGIKQQINNNNQLSKYNNFVSVMYDFMADPKRENWLTDPNMYISRGLYSFNTNLTKRISSYIKMIQKI